MKIFQIFNHTRWRFAEKVNFFGNDSAGAQDWALEQFDKVKVKLLEREKNFPWSRFAGGSATQVRWKRFKQRFLKNLDNTQIINFGVG